MIHAASFNKGEQDCFMEIYHNVCRLPEGHPVSSPINNDLQKNRKRQEANVYAWQLLVLSNNCLQPFRIWTLFKVQVFNELKSGMRESCHGES